MQYDYVIVGAGLTGAVLGHELTRAGKRCLVLERRDHIGGNIYTRMDSDIHVHQYGAHIFHTNNQQVWTFVSRFVHMNRYTHSPIALYHGEMYNLPFNMNTFYQMWKVTTPQEAMAEIQRQRLRYYTDNPQNLEEQAINLVGMALYQKLIKEYTEKQWGRPCRELPAWIIKRLPVRFTYDNNYFDALYQGIPEEGYTALIANLLAGVDVETGVNYLRDRSRYDAMAGHVIFTGCIDAYFDFCYGPLAYRSVRFEEERLDVDNYQGNSVVNYTDSETPYTRIIEHKHFALGKQPHTIISREYSKEWTVGEEPFYPINDQQNMQLYERYRQLAQQQNKAYFCGRLGRYQYVDMDQAVEQALTAAALLVE